MSWESLRHWGPDARRIEKFTDGVANDVWRVQIAGRPAVARLGNRTDADLAWEVELMHHLDGIGLTVPLPIPTLDERFFVDGLMVMTWVEGEPPATEIDWRRAAKVLRTLHAATVNWPQRPGWRSSTDLIHADSGTKVDLSEMPPEAVSRCRAAWQGVSGKSRCVVHGDHNPGNIRVTADRVALIDWDEAHVDVPLLDLALPHNAADLSEVDADRAHQASSAWEAAICWDDDYARTRLAEVRPVP